MRIRAAQLRSYSLPLTAPVVTAKTVMSVRRGWIVALDDEDGNRGQGDAAPWPGFGSSGTLTRQTLRTLLNPSGPVVGASVDEPDAFLVGLPGLASVPEARAALELALLDLFAQRKGVSVANLLSHGSATSVELCHLVATADDALAAVSKGIKTLKIKVGASSVADDVARVRRIRDAVGTSIALRLDANGGWTVDQAQAALDGFQAVSPAWVEQPLAPGSLDALQSLRRSSNVPIAVDEGLKNMDDLVRHMEAGALDVAVLKPMFLGGLLPAKRMAEKALSGGLRVVVSTAMESAVGRQGALHLAAAISHAEPFGLGSPLGQDVATMAPCKQGRLYPSAAPGLGVELRDASGASDLPNPVGSTALARPDHPVLVTEEKTWTAAELARAVATRAAWLQGMGVQQGDLVALLGTPNAQWVTTWHALGWIGACGAPLSPSATPAERAQTMATMEPDWAVGTTPESVEALRLCRPNESVLEMPEEETDSALSERGWPLDEARAWLATSGTSGAARAVLLRTRQWAFSAFGSAIRLGHEPSDVWLACLPLHHVGGLSILMRCAWYGTTVHLEPDFDAGRVAETLDAGRATLVSLVPTMLERVLDARDETPFPSTLRAVLVGGAPLPAPLLARCKRLNVPLALTWGMTETTSQVATTHPGEDVPAGCAGPPLAFARVTQGPLGLDVHGPIVERPLATHDRGTVDDTGRVWIHGRRDDAITSGGETFDPADVEAVLCEHPHVADAAVVGEPDEAWGERPVAWLVRASGEESVGDDVLTQWCAARLSRERVPERFEWVDELPRDALGKLARQRLRTDRSH